jgi:hypothetical protein
MAKRLQVILQDAEYRDVQRAARARRMSIAEWVRQALSHARRREPLGDVEKKLAVVRAAVANNAGPATEADIETMLGEIEQGYLSDRSFDSH